MCMDWVGLTAKFLAGHTDNIDNDLVRYMERYFKAEVKKKQRADDIERGIETFGPSYKHTECTMM
jgi:E3 ubiquitin-protein ligase BAH